jgi:hypothetical protein
VELQQGYGGLPASTLQNFTNALVLNPT